ncbi:hypothetical protein [Plastoroseomonas hellenica]|uniref:hypothetical protein n=1 Tax=Plastoroseomonas hellenica TaxID=2687306 RepID=UPI001BAB6643|nr:hypothetical protein [Plastoroseomonas hellenica]MBR0645990.1 hypothetical protein [Plastoroseomonas hellenica]
MASRRLLLILGLLSVARGAEACAVATTIRVENGASEAVRTLQVLSPSPGSNQAPQGGVAPGQAVPITLPSCIGVYGLRATFASGRAVDHPNLDARTIRGLVLR